MSETKIEMKLEEETKSLKKVCEKLEEVVKHQFDNGIEQIDTKEMGEVIDMWRDLCEAKEKIVKSCYYTYILKAMEKEEEEDEEYKKFMEKMRMSGDTEEDDMERRYYDNYRYKTTGRFAPKGRGSYMPKRGYTEPMMPEVYNPMEYMRDVDREQGRMYFSSSGNGGNSGGGSSSGTSSSGMSGESSGNSSRGYSEGYSDGQTRGYSEGYERGRNEGSRNNQRDGREGRSGQSRRSYMETKEMNSDNSPESKQKKMRELEKYMGELSSDLTEMISGASNEEKTMLKTKLQTLVQKIQ